MYPKSIFISLLLLILFALSPASHANEQLINPTTSTIDTQAINYAVGLNAGSVVGNGIIVRNYFTDFYLQATFAGYIDKPANESYLNFSSSFVKYLSIINNVGNVAPVGLKWVSGFGIVYDKYDGKTNNKINLGSGIGLDFGAVNKPGLIYSLNAIYTASFEGFGAPRFSTLSFQPTFGLLYNFY